MWAVILLGIALLVACGLVFLLLSESTNRLTNLEDDVDQLLNSGLMASFHDLRSALENLEFQSRSNRDEIRRQSDGNDSLAARVKALEERLTR